MARLLAPVRGILACVGDEDYEAERRLRRGRRTFVVGTLLLIGALVVFVLLALLGLVDPSVHDNCLAAWRIANALLLGLLYGLLVRHVFRQFELAGGLVLGTLLALARADNALLVG